MTIQEHGIRYRIHFEEGHKTGFFCDQRDNRRELARYCEGRSVLDLCCYTGGFGLNALIRGKAREVTCVDLDEKAVALAKENGNANQVRLDVVHADAFGYMRQMGIERADLRRDRARPAQADPRPRRGRAGQAEVLRPERAGDEAGRAGRRAGHLLVLGPAPAPDFLGLLRAAARKAGRPAQLLAFTGAAADHPVALDTPESAYLKVAWLRMGDSGA